MPLDKHQPGKWNYMIYLLPSSLVKLSTPVKSSQRASFNVINMTKTITSLKTQCNIAWGEQRSKDRDVQRV